MLKAYCLKNVIWLFVLFYFTDAQKGVASDFECPNDKSGQYEDSVQCDKYYECDDGVATEKLCPDGLVFDQGIRLKNKCDQPFNVDCGKRELLRKSQLFSIWLLSFPSTFFNMASIQIFKIFCLLFRTTKGNQRKMPTQKRFLRSSKPSSMQRFLQLYRRWCYWN